MSVYFNLNSFAAVVMFTAVITARGSDGSIVFSIVAKFFSLC